MKNTIGTNLTVTLFGESHGAAVGAVIDGLTPGIPVSQASIAGMLARRRPATEGDTARRETDDFQILSGVWEGKATGTPLCIIIPNADVRSTDYTPGIARPSHADYAAQCKYHGAQDYRGGGHFSGRVTAALTAVGGILLPALARVGITVGTHIARCGGTEDTPFGDDLSAKTLTALSAKNFPTNSESAGARMQTAIRCAREDGDSIGGVTETAVLGLPAGVGEPWFDSVEGALSRGLFGIGGVKGVEFGLGFAFAVGRGSTCNDPFYLADGQVCTRTNHSGGINGGITNGMPVIFRCAVRPTPSIAKEQQTVDFLQGVERPLAIRGRHDPCILRRVCPVVDSVTAIVLCDLLLGRYGTDFLQGGNGTCATV